VEVEEQLQARSLEEENSPDAGLGVSIQAMIHNGFAVNRCYPLVN
jgi:hypothetical protein